MNNETELQTVERRVKEKIYPKDEYPCLYHDITYKQEPHLVVNPHCIEPITCVCGKDYFSFDEFSKHSENCRDWANYNKKHKPEWKNAYVRLIGALLV